MRMVLPDKDLPPPPAGAAPGACVADGCEPCGPQAPSARAAALSPKARSACRREKTLLACCAMLSASSQHPMSAWDLLRPTSFDRRQRPESDQAGSQDCRVGPAGYVPSPAGNVARPRPGHKPFTTAPGTASGPTSVMVSSTPLSRSTSRTVLSTVE